MFIVFDISSSLQFWRLAYPLNRAPSGTTLLPDGDPACTQSAIRSMTTQLAHREKLVVDGRFHMLGFKESCRRKSKSHIVRIWGYDTPYGSFYQLKDGIFIGSPEFIFLRAASILPFTQLITLGDELCGFYSFDKSEERGFRKRRIPLCSKSKLTRFLDSAKGCRGHDRAVSALAFVIDHSASPMETFDEITMCLPYRYGGYGIPQPTMNLPVPLTSKAARIARRRKCYLDMGWAHERLDVEHHGKLDHSSDIDKASDRARVNALKEMEFEVIELTYDQVKDVFAYEYIIARIAGLLDKRLDKSFLGATPERIALRKSLMSWQASYGAIVW